MLVTGRGQAKHDNATTAKQRRTAATSMPAKKRPAGFPTSRPNKHSSDTA